MRKIHGMGRDGERGEGSPVTPLSLSLSLSLSVCVCLCMSLPDIPEDEAQYWTRKLDHINTMGIHDEVGEAPLRSRRSVSHTRLPSLNSGVWAAGGCLVSGAVLRDDQRGLACCVGGFLYMKVLGFTLKRRRC